jgi:hypothetical protein
MKLDSEFPLANHRNISTVSITGMLQETSKELMINYILAWFYEEKLYKMINYS